MAAADVEIGSVQVLVGNQNGKYPFGNSILVRGREATAIIDPSLSLLDRQPELGNVADLVVLSHVHEDHVAGLSIFDKAEVFAHALDLIGIHSLDGLMEIYGYDDLLPEMRKLVVEQFHYVPRPDAQPFPSDSSFFDLGGVRIRPIHLPGHTRGHCALLIEPENVLFLGDIELSSFGPYYGDAWSDLRDFEKSCELIRDIEAKAWVSFHHVGVIQSRDYFLERLERFVEKFSTREQSIFRFLDRPRSLDELVEHRFLYPKKVTLPFVEAVEKRSIEQHLARLVERGQVRFSEEQKYLAT